MKETTFLMIGVMMMMEVFVSSLEGGRMAGALPQSPDVQPSRRGTYMHVEQVQSYVWTYNRLVIHTHTHPGQCACGMYKLRIDVQPSQHSNSLLIPLLACMCEHQPHHMYSQPWLSMSSSMRMSLLFSKQLRWVDLLAQQQDISSHVSSDSSIISTLTYIKIL